MSELQRDEALERELRLVERPRARPAFRDELRERFLAAADSAREPAAAPMREPAATPARRRRFPLVPFALLAAAAAVVAMFFTFESDTPDWRVESAGTGSLLVDGVAIDLRDHARLERALLSARTVETQANGVRLVRRDELVLDLGPQTRLAQMRFAATGGYALFTDVGSLRVGTGAPFRGQSLRVQTRDLDLSVVGTMFAVDVEAEGTCVCCLEGRVAAQPKTESVEKPVEAGRMCYAASDRTRAPLWGEAMHDHVTPLVELRAALPSVLQR